MSSEDQRRADVEQALAWMLTCGEQHAPTLVKWIHDLSAERDANAAKLKAIEAFCERCIVGTYDSTAQHIVDVIINEVESDAK